MVGCQQLLGSVVGAVVDRNPVALAAGEVACQVCAHHGEANNPDVCVGGSVCGVSHLVYAAPSNMLVTEPSSNTSLIAFAKSGAIDSTVSLSKRFSGETGRVSVTTTWSM